MRGLSKRLIENILSFDPKEIRFVVEYPEYVMCEIQTEGGEYARGITICSISEYYWDERRAKNLAAGRALKALAKKEDSEPIRYDYEDFPKSWSIRQAERVMDFAHFGYKSSYNPIFDCDCVNL